MKQKLIFVILTLYIFSFKISGNDIDFNVKYNYYTNTDTVLTLEFEWTENTTITIYEPGYTMKSVSNIAEKLNINSIIDQVIVQIINNADIEISYNIPNYFNDVVELMDKKSDKETAIALFKRYNYEDVITYESNENISSHAYNKRIFTSLKLIVPISVRNNTILDINELEILLEDQKFLTENKQILIE